MSGFLFDTAVGTLASLDAAEVVVVVLDTDYVPSETQQFLDEVTGSELGRDTTTLTVTRTGGTLRVDLDDPIEITTGAARVAGWVVALDTGVESTSALLVWQEDFGGIAPDPYPVACPDGLAVAERG